MTGDVRTVPQMVLSPLTSAALFLVATIDSGGESLVRELLSDIALAGTVRGGSVPSPTAD